MNKIIFYKLILLCVLQFVCLQLSISQERKCSCTAILVPKQVNVPVYKDTIKKIIIGKIINDTINEEYYILSIIKINKQWAYVNASTPFDSTPKIGWIQTKYIGIYPSNFSSINLYTFPNKNTKIKSIIIKPEYYPFNVLDCRGKWLYVSYLDADGRIKEGWLAPEDQCSNPYSTCN